MFLATPGMMLAKRLAASAVLHWLGRKGADVALARLAVWADGVAARARRVHARRRKALRREWKILRRTLATRRSTGKPDEETGD
jgi:hypothetical protein